MIVKGIRYCDCCGIRLNKKNNKGSGKFELKFSEKVPGSVLFEIVNKHASAKL